MTVDEKLNELGMAWIRIYQAVDKLADRIDDADVTEAERAMIALRMPTLRADRDALQSRLVALSANSGALGFVSDQSFQQMKDATTKLQALTAGNALVTELLNLVTDSVKAARTITG